jgi:hypothetical protein
MRQNVSRFEKPDQSESALTQTRSASEKDSQELNGFINSKLELVPSKEPDVNPIFEIHQTFPRNSE